MLNNPEKDNTITALQIICQDMQIYSETATQRLNVYT